MDRVSTFLWFNDQAEEAANFYTSIFKNSKVKRISRYGEAGPRPAGSVLVVDFELDGRSFQALNGGPMFKFTGISFVFPDLRQVLMCSRSAESKALRVYLASHPGRGGKEA